MTGERLGPCRLERELGSGGMGTVYRATLVEAAGDLPAGAVVALKILDPRLLPGTGARERFEREAALGRRVRHGNVVRTLDAGSGERGGVAVSWLVMEYVEGRTLRRVLADLGPLPEGLLREIASQAAAGLDAIHEAGAVHRDLKPENLILSDDQRIRVMDLGIARLLDASTILTGEGQFAGTLWYAAPEQFQGAPVGPAADLYSLGVVLHELATGENPFRHEEPGAVMRSHLLLSPPPLDEVRPDFSPFFARVVSALLAKDPAGRFPSAAALRRVLAEGEEGSWWKDRGPEGATGRPRRPRIPLPRETRFIGREMELLALRAAWDRVARGDGRVVLVTGEPGVGKSRLADRFLEEIPPDRARILYGGYFPGGGTGGLSDAILDHFGDADLEAALAPHLGRTPSLAAAVAAKVRLAPPPPGAPPVTGDVLETLMVDLLRSLAADRPVVWVLDDYHFAEPESRRIVLAMARAAAGHRVLLLVLSRPDAGPEVLAPLLALPVTDRIAVGRLSPREVVEILREALRSETLADRLGAKIAFKSDGVPFFLFEILRGLREGGLLARQTDGSFVATRVIDAIEVPSTVRGLIEDRLRDLPDEDRAILDVGAVQGVVFDADLIAEVRGAKRVVVLERLAAIERRTGVVRAEGPRFRFDHHQLMEVVYEGLPESLRREYHALLSEARRPSPAAAGGEAALFVASHGLRGARPESALPWLGAALDHLGSIYRSESAVRLAEAALALPGGLAGADRVGVLLRKAECEDTLGWREAQRRTLDEALAIAEASGEASLRARALNGLAGLDLRTGRYEEAREGLRRALELAREAGDRREEAAATLKMGTSFHASGRHEDARHWFELHLARAREDGDRWAERAALGNLAVVLAALGRHDEALALHEECLAIVREIGDRRGEAMTSGNLGTLLTGLGRFEEARARLAHALALCREIGYRQGEAYACGNLGSVFSALGRPDLSMDCHRRAAILLAEIGDTAGEGRSRVNLGCALLALGEREAGRREIETGLAIAERIGDRVNAGGARTALARAALAEGNFRAAEEGFRLTLADRRERGQRRSVLDSLAGLGEVLAETGRGSEARACLEEALRLAREMALPEAGALVLARLAAMGAVAPEEARRASEAGESRMAHLDRLELWRLLWRATGDPRALARARGLLRAFADRLPADRRDAVLAGNPRYRELLGASG